MAIDFRRATDELFTCISHEELAKALDKSVPAVRQARLDRGAKAYRTPPDGWERAVSKLASQRAARLMRLVRALDSRNSQETTRNL